MEINLNKIPNDKHSIHKIKMIAIEQIQGFNKLKKKTEEKNEHGFIE